MDDLEATALELLTVGVLILLHMLLKHHMKMILLLIEALICERVSFFQTPIVV